MRGLPVSRAAGSPRLPAGSSRCSALSPWLLRQTAGTQPSTAALVGNVVAGAVVVVAGVVVAVRRD
ncbi:hypothetical protein [Amycolatopsis sp. RTGN1]|uniref:hypothetical protein n=1 Tax=Amycolatopsis ponsaeliensis TaxID=2992142 RepID=UPI00254D028E|nr:hypothetical protein [Amycolatopsis sp. RTGN1]